MHPSKASHWILYPYFWQKSCTARATPNRVYTIFGKFNVIGVYSHNKIYEIHIYIYIIFFIVHELSRNATSMVRRHREYLESREGKGDGDSVSELSFAQSHASHERDAAFARLMDRRTGIRLKTLPSRRADVEQSLRKFDGGGKHPCDTSHGHGCDTRIERLRVQQRRWTIDGHGLVRKCGHRDGSDIQSGRLRIDQRDKVLRRRWKFVQFDEFRGSNRRNWIERRDGCRWIHRI